MQDKTRANWQTCEYEERCQDGNAQIHKCVHTPKHHLLLWQLHKMHDADCCPSSRACLTVCSLVKRTDPYHKTIATGVSSLIRFCTLSSFCTRECGFGDICISRTSPPVCSTRRASLHVPLSPPLPKAEMS